VTIFKRISRLPEFDRDLKKLRKRFRTIDEDLESFIKTALNLYHKLKISTGDVLPIGNLGTEIPIYKARKFACRSLKGRGAMSGIRVIYTYFEEHDEIQFIEIYFKGDKANEDRKRILKHYKSMR
jgi:hypothetical protein